MWRFLYGPQGFANLSRFDGGTGPPLGTKEANLEPLSKQVASGSGWSRIIHVKDEEESLRKSTWIATAEDPPGCRSSLPSPTSSGAIRGTGAVEHTVRPQESNRQQRRGYHVDIGVQRAVRTTEEELTSQTSSVRTPNRTAARLFAALLFSALPGWAGDKAVAKEFFVEPPTLVSLGGPAMSHRPCLRARMKP